MTAAPRVSVVVPLYNGARFIAETIESVLAQTFDDLELVIVDDGSGDGGDDIARTWARAHPDTVRVIAHPGRANRGAAASRNVGIAAARGALIAFIDADDTWPREKLAQQVALFDVHPALGMVAGAALYWSSWEGGDDRLVRAGHRRDVVIPPGEAMLSTYPLGRAQAPCPSAVMVRREALAATGGFEAAFTGPLQLYEDQAFLTKLYLDYPVYFDSRCQLNYRQHDASCVAQTVGDGKYLPVRRYYLVWLTGYLRRRRLWSPALWRAVAKARFGAALPGTARLLGRLRGRARRVMQGR
ncbi:hypothetical protein ASG29_04120 [Sphingomonas sp. Leaf412]|uniref:glycosyltransferase family 2 protein n=1 Tax=Sphingomonas sp. Leaf412 TaxID=1736370 RepID=UPI0006FC682F|nr:glycosyltransferase family 2 protein [Sphingomonas sp. Leaf412]KQT35292.1 hypothetical protein ASG29_04120 [Sphingomonas sp. Leaf412]